MELTGRPAPHIPLTCDGHTNPHSISMHRQTHGCVPCGCMHRLLLYAVKHPAATRMASTLQDSLRHLADQVNELQPHQIAQQLQQLANSARAASHDSSVEPPASKKARKAPRVFDFSKYRQRYVALELMYVGTTYQGFARQDSTDNTIEGALFAALRKTRLIPEDTPISSLQYSRCGRTDKGVSALGQVVALMLRSAAKVPDPTNSTATTSQPQPPEVHAQPGEKPGPRSPTQPGVTSVEEDLPPPDQELDYPRLINRALPPDIRVLGWAPVPLSFNARFSARFREYKYFIVDSDRTLDIAAMQRAAQLFVGHHDFRNFCKPDVLAVKSFDRIITSFTLEPFGVQATLPYPSQSPQHQRQQQQSAVPASSHSQASGDMQGCQTGHSTVPTDLLGTGLTATATAVAQPAADSSTTTHTAAVQHLERCLQQSTAVTTQRQLLVQNEDSDAQVALLQQSVASGLVPALAVAGHAGSRGLQGTEQPHPETAMQLPLQSQSVARQCQSQVYVFTVRGTAFLWHQVRCMVAVLLMVGQRLETPDIVPRLLDIHATPAKPQYAMAPEEPLLLYACGFEDLNFIRSGDLAAELSEHVRAFTHRHLVAASLTGIIATRLAADQGDQQQATSTSSPCVHRPTQASAGKSKALPHIPLLKRPVEMSVAERMQKHGLTSLGSPAGYNGTREGHGPE